MKESKLNSGLLAAIAAVALAAPAIAIADAKSELQGVSVKVSYADLNLEKRQGAETLYRRLVNASKQACDMHGLRNAGSVRRITEQKQCFRESLAAAVEELDNVHLTQLHAS